MPPVSGIESRRLAWSVLLEQDTTGAFFKDLFAMRLGALREDDAALARAICLGVLRFKRLLDYNLGLHASRNINDARLRMLLRVGAQQILFLSGVPDFAAVNTTVEIVKREIGKPEAGFANAVLKAVARDGLRVPEGNTLKALAVRYSHPEWLVRRWAAALKPQALESALVRNNEEAPQWIRANPRRGTPAEVAALPTLLEKDGAVLEAHAEAPLFFRVVEGTGNALRSDAFAEGRFSFQDPVSLWVVSLLDWHPGLSLLDTCAAPGGKSALALELAASRGENLEGARIVCADISSARLRRIRDARVRLGHAELMPVCMDVSDAALRGGAGFDRILIDAPCSNLGVLRRRPEARWHWTPEKTAALAGRQRRLLEDAAMLLKPGGRLVYATCSAEDEETVDVVRAFLAAHPEFKAEDAGGVVPGPLCREGFLRVWPGETEYDGFFAAAITREERTADS
jgi:16S rRNA (cytosine967-C5)-methyltransferase